MSTTQSNRCRHTHVTSITTSSYSSPYTATPSSPVPSHLATIASTDVISLDIHTNNTTKNTIRNYASATAIDNSPSREQALVFNSIDSIPQRDYILAIGKITSPKNIVFVSRISNNRFYIFFPSKKILDPLLESTQTIKINEQLIQIRRLINTSKRIVISNVYPSITNRVIIDPSKSSTFK